MGIELERFVSFVDDELKCSICCGVLENAVQINQCEHAFCSDCIKEWYSRQNTCPIDRRQLNREDIIPASRLLNYFINKLSIKCKFALLGCPTIVSLESLTMHLEECRFNPDLAIPCERGCGILLTAKQRKDHNCILEDIIINIENQSDRIQQLENKLNEKERHLRMSINQLEIKCKIINELEMKYLNMEKQMIQFMKKMEINGIDKSESNENIDKNLVNSLKEENANAHAKLDENKLKTINIEVDHKLKTINLWANVFEPIINIKERISSKEEMPIYSQCLFHGDELLENEKTLNDYNIIDANLILVKRPIKIDIIISKENLSLTVEPNETILSVKAKVKALTGISTSLSYFGQILDDSRTLFSYRIRERAKLKVVN